MSTKMKLLVVTLVSFFTLAAFGAGIAFAQTPTPPPTTGFGPGWMMRQNNGQTGSAWGPGRMMGGNFQNGDYTAMAAMHQWMSSTGGMHTQIWTALAGKLSMTSDELTAAVNGGQNLAQVGESKGVSRADLVAALEAAHKDSLAQAVKDGALTQAQADTMLSQMAGRYEWMLDNSGQFGRGMMNSAGGFGRGMMGGAGGCGGRWNNANVTPQPKP